jgi:hypothetical protein
MGVIQGKVVREALTLSGPEDLSARKMDEPFRPGQLGGQQRVPGALDVDRHDLLWAAGRVMGQRPEMDDGRTPRRRSLHLGEIKKIVAVGEVEAGHVVSEGRQVLCYRGTHVAAVAGDENAHADHALA